MPRKRACLLKDQTGCHTEYCHPINNIKKPYLCLTTKKLSVEIDCLTQKSFCAYPKNSRMKLEIRYLFSSTALGTTLGFSLLQKGATAWQRHLLLLARLTTSS